MTPEQAEALRKPFPPEAIGKLPKAGIKLDYVGHAGVTDRLLAVDPEWTWEPAAVNEFGVPLITAGGLWIKLTVCGVTRFGWGDGPDIKQMISDAIRNAAMRFGVALDLWSKEDLHAIQQDAEASTTGGEARIRAESPGAETDSAPPAPSKARRDKLKSKCVALQADGVSIADEREQYGLPLVDSCNEEQLAEFEDMVEQLEAALAAPFEKADA